MKTRAPKPAVWCGACGHPGERHEAGGRCSNCWCSALARRTDPRCRRCWCTETEACVGGCYWVEPDLCSKCIRVMEALTP
jgi:hypothetical protein